VAPIPAAQSLEMMSLSLVIAGIFIAPTAAASYVLVDSVSPRGCRTEAFTWMSTAVAAGGALGSVAGGALIDSYGVHASLVFAAIICGVGALLVTSTGNLLVAARTNRNRE
jgi:MFS family permease